jgi:hypothetical protein
VAAAGTPGLLVERPAVPATLVPVALVDDVVGLIEIEVAEIILVEPGLTVEAGPAAERGFAAGAAVTRAARLGHLALTGILVEAWLLTERGPRQAAERLSVAGERLGVAGEHRPGAVRPGLRPGRCGRGHS